MLGSDSLYCTRNVIEMLYLPLITRVRFLFRRETVMTCTVTQLVFAKCIIAMDRIRKNGNHTYPPPCGGWRGGKSHDFHFPEFGCTDLPTLLVHEDLIVKVSHILQILAFFSEYLRRLCVLRDITSFSAFSDTPNSYLSRKKIRSEKFCLSAKLERF